MKTLADMTEEERANCPGMWATSFIGYTGVIVYQNGRQAYLIIPEYNREQTFPLDEVTPRPDLPRAWHADGTPPAGEWEHASQSEQVTPGSIWDLTTKKTPTHRRWIGTWEEV